VGGEEKGKEKRESDEKGIDETEEEERRGGGEEKERKWRGPHGEGGFQCFQKAFLGRDGMILAARI
jgi:hypothetical protein